MKSHTRLHFEGMGQKRATKLTGHMDHLYSPWSKNKATEILVSILKQ